MNAKKFITLSVSSLFPGIDIREAHESSPKSEMDIFAISLNDATVDPQLFFFGVGCGIALKTSTRRGRLNGYPKRIFPRPDFTHEKDMPGALHFLAWTEPATREWLKDRILFLLRTIHCTRSPILSACQSP